MRTGFLFQRNHVDPPLRVKGAGTIYVFNIQRKLGDVNRKKPLLISQPGKMHFS
jgi:hypothetical protein